MDQLIRILRAAHCRSTHQFFVVDALPQVTTDQGKQLSTQLLKHYKQYLIGAKAPDKEFRDFRNHVVHVRDNHWGGAAKSAQEWYVHFVRKIRQSRWSDAAYCAGVLSHYFTDPLMPLHTAQSTKESVVHRPLEWSVTKSYDKILSRYREGKHKIVFETSRQHGWLGAAVIQGAELSNRHYDELIDRYDLEKGARRPVEGLDDASIDILAGLFGIALTGWARIIERAAEESNVQIPEAPLSVASLVASISMPVGWIVRRISSAAEQKAVRAIFEEFQATGEVTENLPQEVRTVSQERRRDLAVQRARESPVIKPFTTPVNATVSRPVTASVAKSTPEPAILPINVAVARDRTAKPSLAMSDDLVDAPSIGPKTAKRFAKIGITTIEQFLSASPESLASQLNTRWIKEETIRDWQDQARLIATVAGLCGYKAQLLVGVECRDRETLASQDSVALHEQIEQYASTKAGKRVLRRSRVPGEDEVGKWIAEAATGSSRHVA